jgi:hypothetical protein
MGRRAYTFMIGNAVVMALLAIVCSIDLGYPLRDPDGFLGPAWMRMPLLLALAFLADVVPRTLWTCRHELSRFRTAAEARVREHWTRERIVLVVLGLAAFYTTYVSYRNLKNFLPFVRPHTYDYALHALDRWLLGGRDPAVLLHTVFGTGIAAQAFSIVYLLFLPLVPVAPAVWLVWSRNPAYGYWFVTADCLAWSLGTASYYLIPTLGPSFAFEWLYSGLQRTGVTQLQDQLFYGRQLIRYDPFADGVQSVAGFASLHVAITLVMALVAHHTVRHRALRVAAWTYLGLVVLSTTYFGWHYIADDVAGAAIGLASVYLGARVTGHRLVRSDRAVASCNTAAEPAWPIAGS